MTLDEKLLGVLRHYRRSNDDFRSSIKTLELIKQAFSEKDYMTGPEWYDMFEKELDDLITFSHQQLIFSESPTPDTILAAAKRASGVSDE
jgi:hypothetical protein